MEELAVRPLVAQRGVADLANRYGSGEIGLTVQQNLILTGIRGSVIGRLTEATVRLSLTVTLVGLASRLRSVFEQRADKTMYIMAAGTLRYGEIVTVIDAARGAGVTRVGIVTDAMRQR